MPFTIITPNTKICVYSPNLTYDINFFTKYKDYKMLTIDKFQHKCQFYYIIDEINYNTYLLKNGMVININRINSGIKLLTIILNEPSEYKIRTLITKFDFDWYHQYNDYNKTQSNCIQTQDHLGNIFKSKREMAKHYSINPSTLDDRLKKQNWSLEKALTSKPSSKHQKHKTIDHLNIEYNSVKELCDVYNITVDTYYIRQYRGWSLKDTLTKSVSKQPYQPKTIIDHNGNKFSSQKEMLQYYNIHKNTYQNRINRGWSLEKALTTPPLKQK